MSTTAPEDVPVGTTDTPTDAPAAAPAPVPAEAPVVESVRPTRSATLDDRLTLVGSAFAALATTWVVYSNLFPFTGTVGFAVTAYVIFMAFYAGLSSLTRPWPVVKDRLMTTVVCLPPALIALALISMLVSLVVKATPVLVHANFFTQDMSGVKPTDAYSMGGIVHAIVGTLIEVAIAVGIALPLGITAALYMSEVGGRGARMVRTVVEAMTALPSIVAGLFIYTVVIIGLGLQPSGLCAALALSVMALPIMARASDVVLRVVPSGLREASYALGAGRLQTVWRVVLPTARPGLATALILGIARVVGETSPLLLTSGATNFFNANPAHNPMTSLPLYVFTAVKSGEPTFEARGYAAATVLLVVVLTLFLFARMAAKQRSTR